MIHCVCMDADSRRSSRRHCRAERGVGESSARRRLEIAAELAVARAKASEDSALIAQQKLRIAKLERQVYGQRSERSARLIDQLALTFEELEAERHGRRAGGGAGRRQDDDGSRIYAQAR